MKFAPSVQAFDHLKGIGTIFLRREVWIFQMIVLLKRIGFCSIHYGRLSREQITDRILGAIENPHVDCMLY